MRPILMRAFPTIRITASACIALVACLSTGCGSSNHSTPIRDAATDVVVSLDTGSAPRDVLRVEDATPGGDVQPAGGAVDAVPMSDAVVRDALVGPDFQPDFQPDSDMQAAVDAKAVQDLPAAEQGAEHSVSDAEPPPFADASPDRNRSTDLPADRSNDVALDFAGPEAGADGVTSPLPDASTTPSTACLSCRDSVCASEKSKASSSEQASMLSCALACTTTHCVQDCWHAAAWSSPKPAQDAYHCLDSECSNSCPAVTGPAFLTCSCQCVCATGSSQLEAGCFDGEAGCGGVTYCQTECSSSCADMGGYVSSTGGC